MVLSDRAGLFDGQGRNGYHGAIDLSGLMRALLHTAHTGNAFLGIRQKRRGVNCLHGAILRTYAAFHTIPGRLRHQSAPAGFFIGAVAGNAGQGFCPVRDLCDVSLG